MTFASADPEGLSYDTVEGAVASLRRGEGDALDRLFRYVYPELRGIAHRHLARTDPSTINTTALVHELYLKLSRASVIDARDRSHFLAIASRAMRQILVDHARRVKSRTGAAQEHDARLDLRGGPDPANADALLALDGALGALASLNPRLSQTVELRFFGGLSTEEAAEVLGVSARTVKRDWRKARAFLLNSMNGEDGVSLRPPEERSSGAAR